MKRRVWQCVVAVLLFGAGWLAGTTGSGVQGVFRLSIDAPTGDTAIKCEGCEFLSWTAEGKAGERQPVFSFTCSDGPCWKAVGVVAAQRKPTLIALSTSRLGVAQPEAGKDLATADGQAR